jgi:peptide/nickel transport system ATP-binding protein
MRFHSGSGKTTIARLILRAMEPDSGEIIFDGTHITKDNLKKIRRECQMIYQDPYASIDPRMKVLDIIKEPLDIHDIGGSDEREKIVLDALHEVRLEPVGEIATKNPHMLSGGQRQRVVIARAIVTKPKLVIADEPVSMLDVSVRSGILELMKELQQKLGISFLYITHDLSTARYIGHTIAIMYLGKIVEMGPINDILSQPKHPYTQALIDSVSEPNPKNLLNDKKIRINDPLDVNVYEGCRFRARCNRVFEKCSQGPPWLQLDKEHGVLCWLYGDSDKHVDQ